jgi:hypothetical protein
MLPPKVFDRSKMGFTVPTMAVLAAGQASLPELLSALQSHEVASYLALDRVNSLWERALAGEESLGLRAWTLFVLLRWLAEVDVPSRS